MLPCAWLACTVKVLPKGDFWPVKRVIGYLVRVKPHEGHHEVRKIPEKEMVGDDFK